MKTYEQINDRIASGKAVVLGAKWAQSGGKVGGNRGKLGAKWARLGRDRVVRGAISSIMNQGQRVENMEYREYRE